MEQLQNVSISGSGRIGGGTYDQVKIAGSGKVTGELECQELHVSGSASLQSNVKACSVRLPEEALAEIGRMAGQRLLATGRRRFGVMCGSLERHIYKDGGKVVPRAIG